MSIADRRLFQKDHIEAHRFDAPGPLAEQAVHCLELVAELTQAGLSFQFKGGNSLLLILDRPARFSIDVDIATDEPRERIEACLDAAVGEFAVFTRWTRRQHKTKPWLPIASYYLFYHAHFVDNPEDAFIMLDVQLSRSPYKTEMRQVTCGDLYTSNEKTEVPLPASIIGDKLLTVGPYTLGIPLGKGKEAQRLKHVFDVSLLLGTGPALGDIRESFYACLAHENSLQENATTAREVMLDTIIFCGSVARYARSPAVTGDLSPVLTENVRGHGPFAAHLFSKEYSWDQLQRDMARVAVCMTAVCTDTVGGGMLLDALNDPTGRRAMQHVACAGLACSDEVQELWNCVCSWLGEDVLGRGE